MVWCLTIADQLNTCWKQTAKTKKNRPQKRAFQVEVASRCKKTHCLEWSTDMQLVFSPLRPETIPTVLHPEVYRGYFAGCCAKRTVSPEQQQLHLGGVMLWYSVYSSLTSFYSEEILWRWLILELEQVHSNLLLLLGEPRGPCREESSDVAHSTVKHKQPEKEHLIEREENCELWVQPYHLDAENLSLSFLCVAFLPFLRKKDPSFNLIFICSTLLTLPESVTLRLAKQQDDVGGPVVLPLHNKMFPHPSFPKYLQPFFFTALKMVYSISDMFHLS